MYQYVEFDGAPLPTQDHQQAHDAMPVESTLLDSIGGAFDGWGSARRTGRRQTITLTGKFTGETVYLSDESGVVLTDESGVPLTYGSPQQYVRGQVSAVMERVGVRRSLWRERLDDGTRQWKTARLLAVPWQRKRDDVGLIAELSCQFETRMAGWRAEDATATSVNTTSGVGAYTQIDNGGSLAVDDAVITVTRTSGTITQVDIVDAAGGIALRWTGSLGAGNVLTIDCGALTVKKDGANAYSGFGLQASHTAQGWLPLDTGQATLLVTTTGGAATVKISFYEQFA